MSPTENKASNLNLINHFNSATTLDNVNNKKYRERKQKKFNQNSKKNKYKIKDVTNKSSISIPIINLGHFLSKKIINNRSPDKILLNDPKPSMIMKLDVEGLEFKILPTFLEYNIFSKLDVLTLEWHINTKEQLIDKENLMKKINEEKMLNNTTFITNIIEYDTEKYSMDTKKGLLELSSIK
jgi:hypothetical protein